MARPAVLQTNKGRAVQHTAIIITLLAFKILVLTRLEQKGLQILHLYIILK